MSSVPVRTGTAVLRRRGRVSEGVTRCYRKRSSSGTLRARVSRRFLALPGYGITSGPPRRESAKKLCNSANVATAREFSRILGDVAATLRPLLLRRCFDRDCEGFGVGDVH
jgi:hypothetical protein